MLTPTTGNAGQISASSAPVSVVIPTVGRPTLAAAVESALAQTPRPVEVLIVVDGTESPLLPPRLADSPRVRVMQTGRRAGPNVARMLGVRHARGTIVAFLDDDDEWLPGKLTAQLDIYQEVSIKRRYPVITCRALVIDPDGNLRGVRPQELYRPPWDLADYLFHRRNIRGLGFAMGFPSLLCGRDLLDIVPLNESLDLHEDWEWLLRASRRDDCEIRMVATPLIRVHRSLPFTSASRSAGGSRRSMLVAAQWPLPDDLYGDFLLGISASMALDCGEWRAALSVAREAHRRGQPSIRSWLWFGLRLLIPAKFLRWVSRTLEYNKDPER